MQPKTNKQFGWFGLLLIAVISGLIVKVVGDPLVELFSPKIEDTLEEAEDWLDEWLDDQDWSERLGEWMETL